MLGLVFANARRNRKVEDNPIRLIYHRRRRLCHNVTLTQEILDGLRELLRNTAPNNDRIIISEHHPLARRIGYDAHKLGKAHVVHTVNELLDFIFHGSDVMLPNEKS